MKVDTVVSMGIFVSVCLLCVRVVCSCNWLIFFSFGVQLPSESAFCIHAPLMSWIIYYILIHVTIYFENILF